jgi:hypothetical protein
MNFKNNNPVFKAQIKKATQFPRWLFLNFALKNYFFLATAFFLAVLTAGLAVFFLAVVVFFII